MNLFFNESDKHKVLMETLDKLNISKMDPVVRIASQDLKKREKMRREKLSKCYTTKWNDLIEIG